MILTPIPPSGTRTVDLGVFGLRPDLIWTPTEQGQRLHVRRRERDIEIWEAAKRSGLRMSEWASIEMGRASVSDEDFGRLMRALEAGE